jgi:hypothetical protein
MQIKMGICLSLKIWITVIMEVKAYPLFKKDLSVLLRNMGARAPLECYI